MRPVDSKYPVSLGYHQKMQSRPTYIHRGIDYATPIGTTVVATVGGTVVHAGRGGMGPSFGIHVVIETKGIFHIYAHLSSESVKVGQKVVTGQKIGLTGATGNVTGPHLHYGEFTKYSYLADRKPKFISVKATVRWFAHRHLNTWGDDGSEGTKSFGKRLPHMLNDLVESHPEVITLNEVRSTQVSQWRSGLWEMGYEVAIADGGNLIAFKRSAVTVGTTYSTPLPANVQGSGRKEVVTFAHLKIRGVWMVVAAAHLEYRPGSKYDAIRVAQAKSVIRETRKFTTRRGLVTWRERSSIGIDENSKTWVRDKAFIPAKFKPMIKHGVDAIYSRRTPRAKRVIKTRSDHPIISVTYERKSK